MPETWKVDVKGLVFRSGLKAFRELYGDAAHERLLELAATQLPHLASAIKHNLVVAGGWYPCEDYATLLEIGRQACPTVGTLHRDVSFHATTADVGGVLRFVLSLCGPSLMLSNHTRIMSAFVRGDFAVASRFRSERHIEVELTNVARTRAGWQDQLGGIEALLAATGRKDVRVRISSGGKEGDRSCIFSVFFRQEDDSNAESA